MNHWGPVALWWPYPSLSSCQLEGSTTDILKSKHKLSTMPFQLKQAVLPGHDPWLPGGWTLGTTHAVFWLWPSLHSIQFGAAEIVQLCGLCEAL